MNFVFLDTVGLLALWDESDQWHPLAVAAYDRIVKERRQVVTTTYVLLECGNAAARRPYRAAVNRLRLALDEDDCLIRPLEEEWQAAWTAFVQGQASGAGIVDQVSFLVMRRLGIRQAFTNDRRFVAAGFETLF